MSPRRTASDLPQFTVADIKLLGSEQFDLSGTIKGLTGAQEAKRSWLLLPKRIALIGDLSRPDPDTPDVSFMVNEQPKIDLVGRTLALLDGYWQAYHVWMVTEADWIWSRTLFQAQDSLSEKFVAEDGKEYVRLTPLSARDRTGSKARFFPQSHEITEGGIVQGGWDHEHCELCRAHINPGHFGYLDSRNHWVCENCYENFVRAHDLSFLQEYWPEVF